MLLSAMMKKYDDGQKDNENYVPLLSQNISVVEVGAYSHVFSAFLKFLSIKTLIFTDLDCAKKNANNQNVKCSFAKDKAETTTNASLKYFLKEDDVKRLVTMKMDDKTLDNGQLLIMFQCEETGYQPSSFEDSFLCCNMPFIVEYKNNFQGLQNREELCDNSTDYYELANHCIKSKTTFALDILMNGGDNNDKWKTPHYIEEGLKWLAQ
jgi:hypothetical protein